MLSCTTKTPGSCQFPLWLGNLAHGAQDRQRSRVLCVDARRIVSYPIQDPAPVPFPRQAPLWGHQAQTAISVLENHYSLAPRLILKLHSVFFFFHSVHPSHVLKYFSAEKGLVKLLMNKALEMMGYIIVLTTFTFPKDLGIAEIMKAYFWVSKSLKHSYVLLLAIMFTWCSLRKNTVYPRIHTPFPVTSHRTDWRRACRVFWSCLWKMGIISFASYHSGMLSELMK